MKVIDMLCKKDKRKSLLSEIFDVEDIAVVISALGRIFQGQGERQNFKISSDLTKYANFK